MVVKFVIFFFLIISTGLVFAAEDSVRSTKYTPEFYIALGVGVFGLLVLAYFIISFFRSPRNKWSEKKRPEPKKAMSQKAIS